MINSLFYLFISVCFQTHFFGCFNVLMVIVLTTHCAHHPLFHFTWIDSNCMSNDLKVATPTSVVQDLKDIKSYDLKDSKEKTKEIQPRTPWPRFEASDLEEMKKKYPSEANLIRFQHGVLRVIQEPEIYHRTQNRNCVCFMCRIRMAWINPLDYYEEVFQDHSTIPFTGSRAECEQKFKTVYREIIEQYQVVRTFLDSRFHVKHAYLLNVAQSEVLTLPVKIKWLEFLMVNDPDLFPTESDLAQQLKDGLNQRLISSLQRQFTPPHHSYISTQEWLKQLKSSVRNIEKKLSSDDCSNNLNYTYGQLLEGILRMVECDESGSRWLLSFAFPKILNLSSLSSLSFQDHNGLNDSATVLYDSATVLKRLNYNAFGNKECSIFYTACQFASVEVCQQFLTWGAIPGPLCTREIIVRKDWNFSVKCQMMKRVLQASSNRFDHNWFNTVVYLPIESERMYWMQFGYELYENCRGHQLADFRNGISSCVSYFCSNSSYNRDNCPWYDTVWGLFLKWGFLRFCDFKFLESSSLSTRRKINTFNEVFPRTHSSTEDLASLLVRGLDVVLIQTMLEVGWLDSKATLDEDRPYDPIHSPFDPISGIPFPPPIAHRRSAMDMKTLWSEWFLKLQHRNEKHQHKPQSAFRWIEMGKWLAYHSTETEVLEWWLHRGHSYHGPCKREEEDPIVQWFLRVYGPAIARKKEQTRLEELKKEKEEQKEKQRQKNEQIRKQFLDDYHYELEDASDYDSDAEDPYPRKDSSNHDSLSKDEKGLEGGMDSKNFSSPPDPLQSPTLVYKPQPSVGSNGPIANGANMDFKHIALPSSNPLPRTQCVKKTSSSKKRRERRKKS